MIESKKRVDGEWVSYKHAEWCDPNGRDPDNLIGKQFITNHPDGDGGRMEMMATIIGKGLESGKTGHYIMRYNNHFEKDMMVKKLGGLTSISQSETQSIT